MVRVLVKSGARPYAQLIIGASHQWMADEPTEKGGEDLGPTPFQLLVSSLGSCIAITVQMYAARKQYPLESVEVEVQGQRAPAEPGEVPEYQMNASLQLSGPLTEEQKRRLTEIAERCPVKRILTGTVRVETSVL